MTELNMLRVNKWLFYFYLLETLIILFLLKFQIISYGIDSTDAMMFFLFTIVLLFNSIIYWITTRVSFRWQTILSVFSQISIAFVSFYYFFEDGFHLK